MLCYLVVLMVWNPETAAEGTSLQLPACLQNLRLPNVHSWSFFRIVTHLGKETAISWSWWHKNGITLFPSSLITLTWDTINNTILTWIQALTISSCCHMHFSFAVNWRAGRLLIDLPYLSSLVPVPSCPYLLSLTRRKDRSERTSGEANTRLCTLRPQKTKLQNSDLCIPCESENGPRGSSFICYQINFLQFSFGE